MPGKTQHGPGLVPRVDQRRGADLKTSEEVRFHQGLDYGSFSITADTNAEGERPMP